MAERKKKTGWRAKLPDKGQVARLAHKEAARQREVVDVVVRLLAYYETAKPAKRGGLDLGVAVELEAHCTRAELAQLQEAHAADRLMINYVKEPAR